MDGATRAATLTNRLMAFSRQLPLAPQSIDANKLVSGISELVQRTLGETIQTQTVLNAGLWSINADVGQLENAILNLCINAKDAMPEGGMLTIETANSHLDDAYAHQPDMLTGQYVLIAVTDTGSGMTEEVANKAFDPFFTTKDVGNGTGLGLSQVYGFIKQSGGHIKIYSEPGHGTTIKMYLPRLLEAGAKQKIIVANEKASPDLRTHVIEITHSI
jgi:signal transduction histidine kinase